MVMDRIGCLENFFSCCCFFYINICIFFRLSVEYLTSIKNINKDAEVVYTDFHIWSNSLKSFLFFLLNIKVIQIHKDFHWHDQSHHAKL